MDNILKNKTAILGIVLLLVAFYAFSVFFGSDGEVIAPETGQNGEEIVKLADELSSINFREDVFSQPGYRMLVDFSTELTSEPMGRANPFGVVER